LPQSRTVHHLGARCRSGSDIGGDSPSAKMPSNWWQQGRSWKAIRLIHRILILAAFCLPPHRGQRFQGARTKPSTARLIAHASGGSRPNTSTPRTAVSSPKVSARRASTWARLRIGPDRDRPLLSKRCSKSMARPGRVREGCRRKGSPHSGRKIPERLHRESRRRDRRFQSASRKPGVANSRSSRYTFI